jgi:glycosyltransferase involved in cell wall biosynthesis
MLEDPDLVGLYNEAAVFACPSIYEPFGIINLEAMACETPVVACAVGGIKEVVVDGETGFLVPPQDPDRLAAALSKVLDDPDLAARMGRAGRARVLEHFTWDRIAEKTVAMYETLVR